MDYRLLMMRSLVCLLSTAAANPMFISSANQDSGRNTTASSTTSTTPSAIASSGAYTTGFPSSSDSYSSRSSSSHSGDTDVLGGFTWSISRPPPSRSFHSTSTPLCNGTYNRSITYVTVTDTVTEMSTGSPESSWKDKGPDLILPPPLCDASVNHPQWGASTQITSTVRATVKTTQEIAQQSAPAITFGKPQAHGQSVPPTIQSVPRPTPPPSPPPGAQNSGQRVGKKPDPALGQALHSMFPQAPANSDGDNGSSNSPNINGVPVMVRPGGAVIGGSSFSPSDPKTHTAVIGGQTFTVLPSGAGVVVPGGATMTATPGGPNPHPFFAAAAGVTMSVDGDGFSFAPTDVVIGGTTYPYATPTAVTLGDGAVVSVGPNGVSVPSASATVAENAASIVSVECAAALGCAAFLGMVFM